MDQLQTDACDELPGIRSRGVAALCWAGEVGDDSDERQVTVASGRRSLGRHLAQTLPPREGGRIVVFPTRRIPICEMEFGEMDMNHYPLLFTGT